MIFDTGNQPGQRKNPGAWLAQDSAHRSAWTTKRLLVWAALLCLGRLYAQDADLAQRENTSFRVAMSSRLFADININDAKASIMAWTRTVAKERGIRTDADPRIVEGRLPLIGLLQSNLVDAASMAVDDFAVVSQAVPLGPIFVASVGGRIAEEYILVAHKASDIQHVRDLGGRTLVEFENARTSLAETWLDTLLLQEGLKPSAEFCKTVTRSTKLTKVVLPVFFRQNDACLVTRGGFDTMQELNPQVGKQLKVLAQSAAMVPVVFCFRANYNSANKSELLAGLVNLHTTPAGLQVLTVFQSDRLEEHTVDCLGSAFELLNRHQKLLAEFARGEAGTRPGRNHP